MARFFGVPLRNALSLGLGGVIALIVVPLDALVGSLLMEDGSNLLLEDGSLILLE